MFSTQMTFIGVDPAAGRRPFTYAALDHERKLVVLARGQMEDVLAFASGQSAACVAVNAPSHPNQGVMRQEQVRRRFSPPPRPGRGQDLRLAEYQLRRMHIRVPGTPAQEDLCPNWMHQGFALYRSLEKMGCRAYPAAQASYQWLEVHPHACFCVLLGRQPFPRRSLEGRLQRQLVLHEQGLGINDPMTFFEEITRYRLLRGSLPFEYIYSAEALDALVAACTAYLAVEHPRQVTLLGSPGEGQIVLPVADLKARY
jgi:hypothetical protein